jgi:hypothetical protein
MVAQTPPFAAHPCCLTMGAGGGVAPRSHALMEDPALALIVFSVLTAAV